MTEDGRRSGYPKGIARRRAIIHEAAQLFAERGYSSGSTRELAARVGMTQSGMLHHFASKEELLTEVLALRDEDLRQALRDAEATELRDVMAVTMRQDEAEPGLTRMFTVLSAEASSIEHPAHDYFTARYAGVSALLEGWYEDACQREEVSPDLDKATVARLIIAVMDGALLQPAFLTDTAPSELTDLLWELLRTYRKSGSKKKFT